MECLISLGQFLHALLQLGMRLREGLLCLQPLSGNVCEFREIPLATLQTVLSDSFGRKKGEIVDWNLGAAAD